MIVRNEDIMELIAEIPDGHKHIRTSMTLHDGTVMTFQEATVANLVRAYITVKTHPAVTKAVMKGKKLDVRKKGYAEWQLLESGCGGGA